jgi:hypothetical protein
MDGSNGRIEKYGALVAITRCLYMETLYDVVIVRLMLLKIVWAG